ncbi:family 30 glycoside hydrolase [Emericellopsis atlantica]|uniref:Family 30 glycoside hydrolase n=1 Tax=Emericellopsis atlantica TaxID=2614577 RepID=A0A9P7ZPX9_9HYPO|nr:family 30 glycoside hydrolase [Emericellopsis atlantica]KAG9255681.1 family 30 glycoside hydrolase [Emericellopsis atlantica]
MILPILAALATQAVASPTGATTLHARQSAAKAYASNENLSLRLSEVDAPIQGAGNPSGATWDLTINDTPSGHKQTVNGFGGTVTDATVTVINSLPDDQRSKLLQELVTSDGANFSFLRHTIAASDLSGPPAYTYDDNGNNADPNMDGFALGDRGVAMAELLAELKGLNGDAYILGSAWSAPGWMKENRKLTGQLEGNNLDGQYYEAYAQYFVEYLNAYAAHGAHVDAITIQNEPLNSQGGGHVTMHQGPDEAASVTQDHVGPALAAAGLGDVRIWAYDHNTDRPDYPQTVLEGAGDYVQATAWHCYANPLDWSVISDFHDRFPDKANYMTECWTAPSTPWHQSSSNTVGPLQNWAEMSGMWTLGTWTDQGDGTFGPYVPGGCDTCRGLFVVDKDQGTYEFTVDYYMLAQYSRFIPRGAVVLDGTGSYSYDDGTGVQSVATANPDGTRTVVAENRLADDVWLRVKTDSGETWSGNVPSNTVVTWVLP